MATERPKRKAIPDRIKLEVVLRQDGRCPHCSEKLGPLKDLNFDHRPAIINRDVNEAGTDYLPAQLDPEFIQAIHVLPCHRERTIGRGGEKRTTTAGSDIGIRDKTKRLVEKRLAREAEVEKELNCEDDNPEIRLIAKSKKSLSNKSRNSAGRIKSAGFRPPARKQARATGYKRKGV
jgi:hypothetical protein